MTKRTDGFFDYEDLTQSQQAQAREWIGKTKLFADDPKAAEGMAFKLRPDGLFISRRHSDRTLSTKRAAEVDAFINKPTRRANDDIASGGVH